MRILNDGFPIEIGFDDLCGKLESLCEIRKEPRYFCVFPKGAPAQAIDLGEKSDFYLDRLRGHSVNEKDSGSHPPGWLLAVSQWSGLPFPERENLSALRSIQSPSREAGYLLTIGGLDAAILGCSISMAEITKKLDAVELRSIEKRFESGRQRRYAKQWGKAVRPILTIRQGDMGGSRNACIEYICKSYCNYLNVWIRAYRPALSFADNGVSLGAKAAFLELGED